MSERYLGLKPFRLAASGLVLTGPGWLENMVVTTVFASKGTVDIYDALSATGTPVHSVECQAGVNEEAVSIPLRFNVETGIYIDFANATFVSGSYSE
jgi:hypothetical protein